MEKMIPRPAIFISHANPEDNEFTVWLGAHLSAAGYEVWADVLKLRGGEDWARKLEKALRERAYKVLLVGTPWGVEKQGVRNEIQIACEVAKKIADDAFIIPLRLQTYDSPFQVVQAQYIDFMNGWGQGLSSLLETLDSYKVPCLQSVHAESVQNWRGVQLSKARTTQPISQTLISSWLLIADWPNSIKYYEFQGAGAEDQAKALSAHSEWPTTLFGRGFFAFADIQDFIRGQDAPGRLSQEKQWWVPYFLENGDHDRRIGKREAENIVSNLTKLAVEKKLEDSQLARYELSAGVSAWWVPTGLIADEKVSFKWQDGPSGRRNLTGEVTSGIRKHKWHYGISVKPRVSDKPHVKIVSRVIFSENGLMALDDAKAMHRLRRSVTKSWRNDRWRDLLLAFLYWFSKGERHIVFPTGSSSGIKAEVPPISMVCPVSIKAEETGMSEDIDAEADDPVFAAGFDDEDVEEADVRIERDDERQPRQGSD
ncbi:MAG: toll/interleukin-1 receptor domain-containing protein [Nitrospira sp.]